MDVKKKGWSKMSEELYAKRQRIFEKYVVALKAKQAAEKLLACMLSSPDVWTEKCFEAVIRECDEKASAFRKVEEKLNRVEAALQEQASMKDGDARQKHDMACERAQDAMEWGM